MSGPEAPQRSAGIRRSSWKVLRGSRGPGETGDPEALGCRSLREGSPGRYPPRRVSRHHRIRRFV